MLYLVIIIVLIVYALFISRSYTLGKFLYKQSMNLERRIAGLQAQTVLVDNTPIHYYRSVSKSAKNKPILLLLHGFSADKQIWHRFAMQAKHHYQLIIPDMLGHGDTPYSAQQSYSTLAQTKMLTALISALSIEKYSVIGNSMGGMIAMHLLQQDAMRLEKAILLDPAGAKTVFAETMNNATDNPFAHATITDFFAFYKTTMANPPFVPPCVLHYVGNNHYVKRKHELAHMFHEFFNLDEFFSDKIDVTPERLKLIWGAKDELLPLTEARAWEALVSRKALVYEDLGHMPMIEDPKRCFGDCQAFLKGGV
jgi:pimeloyl-ACP methyl ester carboxylesterase